MAVLTINANDVADAPTIQVRYRVLNSGLSYTVINLTPDQLPYVVNGVQSAQYEVGVRKMCSNSAQSDWITSQSTPCAPVVSFQVVKTGVNFVVTATIAGPQNIIKVQVTDPNGGVQNYDHTFMGQSGSFNIPVTSNLYGTFAFQAQGVCDNDATPIFASILTAPAYVDIPAPGGAIQVSVAPSLNDCRIVSLDGDNLPAGTESINQYPNMAPQSFPFEGVIEEQLLEIELTNVGQLAVHLRFDYSDNSSETFDIANNSGTFVIHLKRLVSPSYAILSMVPGDLT